MYHFNEHQLEKAYQNAYEEAIDFLKDEGINGKIYLAVLMDDFTQFKKLYLEYFLEKHI